MDFYCIPTLKNMELSLLGDRLFCLAHFYKQYPCYREFFLQIKKKYSTAFITLDNSAAERSLVTEDVLIEIVEELRPSEVIAPDVLFNKKKTLENLDKFIKRMDDEGLMRETKIFGCPQGETKEAWIEAYDAMLTSPAVSVIGMSKLAIPYAWLDEDAEPDQGIREARGAAVGFLRLTNRIKKPLHFLGMGDPAEFRCYTPLKEPLLRSSDSCYSVLAATEGILFDQHSTKRVATTEEFYHKKLTEEQITMTIRNMFYLKKFTNY